MMNWIWLGFILISVLVGGLFDQMDAVTLQIFDSCKTAVQIAINLIGVMAFFLGLMKVAEHAGLMLVIAKILKRPMKLLFPDIPEDHPAMSAMILNFAANMLGLANAATPFGIKAMIELNKLNQHKGTASDAMCLFLAINTSSLTLLVTGTMGVRAALGSTDPACIWIPSLMSSFCATVVGITSAKIFKRLGLWKLPKVSPPQSEQSEVNVLEQTDQTEVPKSEALTRMPKKASRAVRVFCWVMMLSFVAAAVSYYTRRMIRMDLVAQAAGAWVAMIPWLSAVFGDLLKPPTLGMFDVFTDFSSFWTIPLLLFGILLFGLSRNQRVYESLVEGAKEGFQVAVVIIPYLAAILVAVGMLQASGAMGLISHTIGNVTRYFGMPIEAVTMAIIRPLSGSGALGYMSSVLTQEGPDSFVGKMVSVMMGSTETTLYVLAVYFGSVQVYRVRYALAAGLLADLMGVVAAVSLSHLFFGPI